MACIIKKVFWGVCDTIRGGNEPSPSSARLSFKRHELELGLFQALNFNLELGSWYVIYAQARLELGSFIRFGHEKLNRLVYIGLACLNRLVVCYIGSARLSSSSTHLYDLSSLISSSSARIYV